MFLAHGLNITFTSNLKLIISLLVLHNTIIIHLFKSYLLLFRSSMLLSLRTAPRLAQKLSAVERVGNADVVRPAAAVCNGELECPLSPNF